MQIFSYTEVILHARWHMDLSKMPVFVFYSTTQARRHMLCYFRILAVFDCTVCHPAHQPFCVFWRSLYNNSEAHTGWWPWWRYFSVTFRARFIVTWEFLLWLVEVVAWLYCGQDKSGGGGGGGGRRMGDQGRECWM